MTAGSCTVAGKPDSGKGLPDGQQEGVGFGIIGIGQDAW